MEFNFTVPGDDFTRAGEASSAIKNKLKQLGLPPAVIKCIAIATYEGEINMVIHANGGAVTLKIDTDTNRITVTLADTGKGIADVSQAMKEGFTTAPDNIRSLGFGAGMGLPNMKKYSDEMTVESTVGAGTTVTMTFNI